MNIAKSKSSDPIYVKRVRELNRIWRRKSSERKEYKEKRKLYMIEWAKNNKDKIKKNRQKWDYRNRAREVFKYAIEAGKIKRLPCIKCGDVKTEGHHKDYSRPLEVVWLCRKHHSDERKLS